MWFFSPALLIRQTKKNDVEAHFTGDSQYNYFNQATCVQAHFSNP